ncbi:MAG TPA: hypothetical protein VJ787_04000 [Thermoleophilia bacterium]|nr:hypothetical protein [Thermoleophilia bacterium]
MERLILWSLVDERCPHCGRTDCPRAERARLERERIPAALDARDGTPGPVAVE